tara:strand:- start:26 stop:415 length:390 start_codon:yes stop_codon:yes gene_type:complete
MKINDLNDLNNLRTAPYLDELETKNILNQIDKEIINSDWITIGIMANSDVEAKKTLNSIIKKYNFNTFKSFDQLNSIGNVFLKANQKTGEVYIRSENGLGNGILLTCQYNELSINSRTFGPFPMNLFCK